MDHVDQSSRFNRAIARFDGLNASDPRADVIDGIKRPREIVYAERLTSALARIYPEASELLRLAARAQHLCRWQVERAHYPMGRDGYNAWRSACRNHHAALATEVLRDCGYSAVEIAHVVKLIRKEDLKRDAESQALENAVAVVFVEHYLAAFAAEHPDYDEYKLLGILRKTMRKLDAHGHAAILALPMPDAIHRLVVLSLQGKA